MTIRTSVTAMLMAAVILADAFPADAGCGCDKAPPPVAAIRPAFASPGDAVTIFGDALSTSRDYVVVFRNGDTYRHVVGRPVRRRDFGDGVEKVQLTVNVPAMPLGPTSVTVWYGWRLELSVSSSSFTMLQRPLALGEETGQTVATCYRAAVGADGTMYLPFDVSAVADRMVFNGLGEGYPLVFGPQDIVIYNTQGVLMQLLGPGNAEIYAIDDVGADASFALTYDRHEFQTYRAEHVHEGALALDPSDPAWHMDGTRHVDHDHLVLAIKGRLRDGAPLRAGRTPAFDLDVVTALAEDGPVSTRTIRWSDECGSSDDDGSDS